MEHLDHMEKRIAQGLLEMEHFQVIFNTLEPLIIELPLQVKQGDHNKTIFQVMDK